MKSFHCVLLRNCMKNESQKTNWYTLLLLLLVIIPWTENYEIAVNDVETMYLASGLWSWQCFLAFGASVSGYCRLLISLKCKHKYTLYLLTYLYPFSPFPFLVPFPGLFFSLKYSLKHRELFSMLLRHLWIPNRAFMCPCSPSPWPACLVSHGFQCQGWLEKAQCD